MNMTDHNQRRPKWMALADWLTAFDENGGCEDLASPEYFEDTWKRAPELRAEFEEDFRDMMNDSNYTMVARLNYVGVGTGCSDDEAEQELRRIYKVVTGDDWVA